MSKRIDLTGQRFGRLVVNQFAGANKNRESMWICKCDCGRCITTRGSSLRNGETKSCGCLHSELSKKIAGENFTTHGKTDTRLFRIWSKMVARTEDPKQDHFDCYGGRGIRVCEEWRNSFQAFYDWAVNNGYKAGLSIDRIDVNGDYSPENCKWSTMKEQSRNRRSNVKLTYHGETMLMVEWSERTGIKFGTLWARIFVSGWTVEEAIETPVGKRRRK